MPDLDQIKQGEQGHWSRVAAEWIAWARAPNHDAFWAYRDSLIAFIGRGKGEALDVGCGEGRVSRELKACGYRVIASDPVSGMLVVSSGSSVRAKDVPVPVRIIGETRPLTLESEQNILLRVWERVIGLTLPVKSQ